MNFFLLKWEGNAVSHQRANTFHEPGKQNSGLSLISPNIMLPLASPSSFAAGRESTCVQSRRYDTERCLGTDAPPILHGPKECMIIAEHLLDDN